MLARFYSLFAAFFGLGRGLLPRRLRVLHYEHTQWRTVRAEHLAKFPACEACGRKTNLEVHHVIPVSVNPARRLDPQNLMTLCATPCHIVFGHLMCYHCYNADVRRMVAAYRAAVTKRSCLESFNKKK
jgi:hypothetical protein